MSGQAFRAVLHRAAERWPGATALSDGRGRSPSFAELRRRVDERIRLLDELGCDTLGLLLVDRWSFVEYSLAAWVSGRSLVPLPTFFHDEQLRSVLGTGVVDLVVTDRPQRLARLGAEERLATDLAPTFARVAPPSGRTGETVTFTSGTTGTPKGVRLRSSDLLRVAESAGSVARLAPGDRHVCLLPPEILLEQVAGVLRSLLAGAASVVPTAEELGWEPGVEFDPERFDAVLQRLRPRSVVLMPEHLARWTEWCERTGTTPVDSLTFVGVGGARVDPADLRRGRALGLPVFQGYGLSEAASIVALCAPAETDAPLEAVGRPLAHVEARVAEDGEVEVRGTTLLGYLGDATPDRDPGTDWWPTGDLGRLDDAGRLFLHGRKRDAFVTSYGRNVSALWIEDLLRDEPAIADAAVHGESRPAPVAAVRTDLDVERLPTLLRRVNARLPGYARLAALIPVPHDDPRRLADVAAAARSGRDVATRRPVESPLPRQGTNSMSFHDRLLRETEPLQRELLEIPFCHAAVHGRLTRSEYVAFLTQAYHHVKHTVPLLMACGARLGPEYEWLRTAVCEYIDEEVGHQEWILADIQACGGDAEAVRHGRPDLPAELLVAYAYDVIARGDPLAFFGMVHVLEGTSVRAATRAARELRRTLGLPAAAFTYLTTHGDLDQDHVGFFAGLMNRLEHEEERETVLRAARVFYKLYGDVFRALEPHELRRADLASESPTRERAEVAS